MSTSRYIGPSVVVPEPKRGVGAVPANVSRAYFEQDVYGDFGLSDSGTADAEVVDDGNGDAAADDTAVASDFRATSIGTVAFVTG